MKIERLFIYCLLAGTSLFASCSSEDMADNPVETLSEGMYPLTFTATKDDGAANTRAAGKDAWSVGDEIGARIGTGTKGSYRIKSTDGSQMKNIDPVYWLNTSPTTVTAWYPKDSKNNVPLNNQSGGFANIDFLKAEAKNCSYSTSTTLNFKYLLAKVKIKLKTTNSTTNLDDAQVSLWGNTMCSYSEGVITGNGTNSYLPTYKEGNGPDATYEALLVPLQMNETRFIRILLKNEKEYYYTTAVTLTAGNLYVYEITVNDGPVVVDLAKITGDTYTAKWDCIINGDANTQLAKNIVIKDGVTVTINNVNIKPNKYTHAISGEGNAILVLEGENTVEGNGGYMAGVHAATCITIKGSGKLTATGGECAPGIGGGKYASCGDIIIEDGTIIATATGGGYPAAGIGCECGNITIRGGNITAAGADDCPGIGSGYSSCCKNIIILGGTVTAIKERQGTVSIGASPYGGCDTITIDDKANVTQK